MSDADSESSQDKRAQKHHLDEAVQQLHDLAAEGGYDSADVAQSYERTIHDRTGQQVDALAPGRYWPPDLAETIATLEDMQRHPTHRYCALHYGFRNNTQGRYAYTWACPQYHEPEGAGSGDRDQEVPVYAAGCGQSVAEITMADITDQRTLLIPTLEVADGHTVAIDWIAGYRTPDDDFSGRRDITEMDNSTRASIATALQTLWRLAAEDRPADNPDTAVLVRVAVHDQRRGDPLPEPPSGDAKCRELGPELMNVELLQPEGSVERASIRMLIINTWGQPLPDAAKMMTAMVPLVAAGAFNSEMDLVASTEAHGTA